MKSALLVIDFIDGIVNGGCKDFIEKHYVISCANKVIAQCRNQKIPIYFIRLAFDTSYQTIPRHSKMFNAIKEKGLFKLGDASAEFISELDYQPNDIVINKSAVSPFHGSDLLQRLKTENIEKLIFTGLATDNAINLGAREAHDLGFFTTIISDACGASSEERHQWSLQLLEKVVNEIVLSKDFY